MTVVLSGVAGDTTNVSPVPSVHADDSFDYLPIPERGNDVTVEDKTYSDWWMPEEELTADEYLDEIRPRGDGSLSVTGEELGDWPLHHDPNFEALTYGERRPAYVNQLKKLTEGDGVLFYTGLRQKDTDCLHRYAIGYFVVETVAHIAEMEGEKARSCIRNRPENAHTKRFEATGELDDSLIVVDGSEGGVFERAHRISTRAENGHYYMSDNLTDSLGVGGKTPYLGGVKQAHSIDVSVEKTLKSLRGQGD